jgi:integrase
MNFERLFEKYEGSPGFAKLSMGSKQTYIYISKRLVEDLGDVDVTTMRRSTFIALQSKYRDRPAMANLMTRIASIVMSYGVDLDILPANPVSGMKGLKTGTHTKWEPEEVRSVIALGDRKISTAVALAWYTGQRESDVLGMRWCDIKDGYLTVTQDKTGNELKIKLHADLIDFLAEIRNEDPEGYYIVSGKERMTGGAFRAAFRRRMDRIGFSDKTFHGIRKGVASSLAENGSSIKEIAAILGHKSIRMAAYYADQASGKKLVENAVSSIVSCV